MWSRDSAELLFPRTCLELVAIFGSFKRETKRNPTILRGTLNIIYIFIYIHRFTRRKLIHEKETHRDSEAWREKRRRHDVFSGNPSESQENGARVWEPNASFPEGNVDHEIQELLWMNEILHHFETMGKHLFVWY